MALLLGLLVAWAHSGPDEHEMSGGEMGVAISICLAVLEGGTVLLLLALGLDSLAARRRAFAPAPW